MKKLNKRRSSDSKKNTGADCPCSETSPVKSGRKGKQSPKAASRKMSPAEVRWFVWRVTFIAKKLGMTATKSELQQACPANCVAEATEYADAKRDLCLGKGGSESECQVAWTIAFNEYCTSCGGHPC